jgi:small GTP-binding protein
MTNFKVVLLGEGRVGKTSIGRRWTEDKFEQTVRSTVKAAYFEKRVTTKTGRTLAIHLWDTAGQEVYHSIAPIYYKDAHAAILVFSVTDEGSFERMNKWKTELLQTRKDNIKFVVVGNKIDLVRERVIPAEKAVEFAKTIQAQYFEVSAKTNSGIDVLFAHLSDLLDKLPASVAPVRKRGKVGLEVVGATEPEQKKKGGCC